MTTKSERLLQFILSYQHQHQRAPTHREIMEGINLSSTSVAASWLARAQREGLLIVEHGLARGIRILRTVEDPSDALYGILCPKCGLLMSFHLAWVGEQQVFSCPVCQSEARCSKLGPPG